MDITPVTFEKLDPCAELFSEVFNLPPWNEGWSKSQALKRLEFYFNTPNFIGLCSLENNNVTGCIFGNFEPNQDNYLYFLKEMYIHPDSQRLGIGKKLIKQLNIELRERNIETLNLISKVGGKAESFYLNNGFYKSTALRLYVSKL